MDCYKILHKSKKMKATILGGVILCLIFVIALFTSCADKNTSDTHTTNVISDHKICFVPLDTRPITYDYPVKLASTYGVKVVYPDMSVMTWFNETGDPSKIRDWLSQNCEGCDAIVVSAEQLVHGGLIQMRKAHYDDGSESATKQLLSNIKTDHPDMKIYLSNVLMRTSNTVLDDESKVWWEKLNEYSAQYYKANELKDPSAIARCQQLHAEIPTGVMTTFLDARKLNHQVNLDCIELAKENVVDKLFIYQEDCATQGIQTVEQNELTKKINQYGVYGKVIMANGTDEGGSELITLAARDIDGCDKAEINTVWLYHNPDFTAKYEDRPFKQNLEKHMVGMNMKVSSEAEDVLLVLPPKNKQADSSNATTAEGYVAYTDEELADMADTIKALEENGKHCYLLDLDTANGGNLSLLKALANSGAISNLYGYSGWNTACNSLGTILAQIYASHGNKEHATNSSENIKLTQERILDDAVYQSQVRSQTNDELKAKGENTYNIADTDAALQILEQNFANNSELVSQIFGDNVPKFEPKFRWPRTFEIEIAVK